MQSKDIILRLNGSLGMFRITIKDSATFQELKTQAATLMKADSSSLTFRINGSRVTQSPNDPLYRIRGLEHGSMVEYEAKSNTMDSEIMSEKPGINPVLNKGGVTASGNRTEAGKVPFGQPPAKPQPEPEKKPEDQLKKKFDKNEAKHVSFDKFLDDNGAHKKREQNKSWITDVFLPLQVDYKPKKITKDITKMTMDTLPPSINMKVQQYRHVDYVQFMNSAEISNFVNYWLNSFEERVGWLYGYYAEDPDYELGIRAVVEAIYEPPQSGTYNNCEIKHDPFETQVEMLSGGLGLQKIGWIYTSKDHDTFMSPEKIQKAAQYQLEHLATHQLGFKVPKFITVVLKRNRRVTPAKKDNSSEILPEVFMISDLGTAMERDGVFTKEQPEKTKLRIRKSDNECIVPNVLMGGTPQVEIDHEFFLISINYGQPKSNKFSILKNYDFPPMNRKNGSTRQDLKKYLDKYGRRNLAERYSNFQLLLYLSREMDIDSALEIANSIQNEAPVSNIFDEMIKSM